MYPPPGQPHPPDPQAGIPLARHPQADTHPWADTAPGRHPLVRHTPWPDTCQTDTPSQQITPGRYPNRQTPTLGRHPPGRHPLPPTATAADGTHPTGMHSCIAMFLLCCRVSLILSDSTVPNIFEYSNCNDLTSVPTFLAFFSTKYAVSSGEEALHRSAQLGIESTPCMAGSIVMICAFLFWILV